MPIRNSKLRRPATTTHRKMLEKDADRPPSVCPVTTMSISNRQKSQTRAGPTVPASLATNLKARSSDRRWSARTPLPGFSAQLPGLVFEISEDRWRQDRRTTQRSPSAKDKKGEPVNAAQMRQLGFVVAWPTQDYKVAWMKTCGRLEPAGNGVHAYKFLYTIPRRRLRFRRHRYSRGTDESMCGGQWSTS